MLQTKRAFHSYKRYAQFQKDLSQFKKGMLLTKKAYPVQNDLLQIKRACPSYKGHAPDQNDQPPIQKGMLQIMVVNDSYIMTDQKKQTA